MPPSIFLAVPGSRRKLHHPQDHGLCDRRAVEARTGIAITPHQFRHISAELYLKDNPEGIFTISQHLAHRDVNTTKRYYARPQQRQASRYFQEHILRSRETARIRIKRTTRRKGSSRGGGSGFDEGSDLL